MMAGTAIKVEWYVAREGKPHGPLSEAEMQKFVELGHLRPSDLVWRTGFVDWQPGVSAFPQLAAPTAGPTSTRSGPDESEAALISDQPSVVEQPLRDAEPDLEQTSDGLLAATAAVSELANDLSVKAVPDRVTAAPERRTLLTRPHEQAGAAKGPLIDPSVALAQTGAPRGLQQRLNGAAPLQPQPAASAAPARSAPIKSKRPKVDAEKWQVDDDDTTAAPPRKSGGRRFAVAVVILFVLAGLGWLGWSKFDDLLGPGMASGILTTAPVDGGARRSDVGAAAFPPFQAIGDTRDLLDANFQKIAIWRLMKVDYPDWYEERLRDVMRMRFEKRDANFVSKALAESITTLRRKNAGLALTSSSAGIRKIAAAFLDSLEALAEISPTACFDYISQGETTITGLDTLRPKQNAALESQMMATFQAISEGRTAPQQHQSGRRADYDTLAGLLIKAGWTQPDLQIFSDPRLLSKAEPPKVCSMVRDWFRTQLSISDPELVDRLLVDSVQPLVAG